MRPRIYSLNTPVNPLLQVVYFVLGGIMLIGAVLMGAVILAIALGLAIIFGLIVYVRVWWLRRKMARSGGSSGPDPRSGPGAAEDVLEVEYTVVEERDDRSSRE